MFETKIGQIRLPEGQIGLYACIGFPVGSGLTLGLRIQTRYQIT